jgi:hypothetical protein
MTQELEWQPQLQDGGAVLSKSKVTFSKAPQTFHEYIFDKRFSIMDFLMIVLILGAVEIAAGTITTILNLIWS